MVRIEGSVKYSFVGGVLRVFVISSFGLVVDYCDFVL